MPRYRLSLRADADIEGIAHYTINKFGMEQSRRYCDGLEASFQLLAEEPLRGRSAEEFATNLRRWNYESHVIFFLPDASGILLVRVLHQRMDFQRHPMTDD